MKLTPIFVTAFVLTLGSPAVVRSEAVSATDSAPIISSRVLDRGAHFKKVEDVRQTVDAAGRATLKTNRYTVLQNGGLLNRY